jgi:hypothetical protein
MARKFCVFCETRIQYTGPGDDLAPRLSESCNTCYTKGGWENTHSDEGHGNETDLEDGCWICHPELDLTATTRKTGHTNTVARSHRSHAGCDHVRTPKARAACRKSGGPK